MGISRMTIAAARGSSGGGGGGTAPLGVRSRWARTTPTGTFAVETRILHTRFLCEVGRMYIVQVHGAMYPGTPPSDSAQLVLRCTTDGTTPTTGSTQLTSRAYYPATSPAIFHVQSGTIYVPTEAGSDHVFGAFIQPLAGAGTVGAYADTSQPFVIYVEDVGPAVEPVGGNN